MAGVLDKQKAIKAYVLRKQNCSVVEIAEKLGIVKSTAYKYIDIVENDNALKYKAQTKLRDKLSKKNSAAIAEKLNNKSEKLVEENEFLKWWCQGERKGWVDRLLDELKKAK